MKQPTKTVDFPYLSTIEWNDSINVNNRKIIQNMEKITRRLRELHDLITWDIIASKDKKIIPGDLLCHMDQIIGGSGQIIADAHEIVSDVVDL